MQTVLGNFSDVFFYEKGYKKEEKVYTCRLNAITIKTMVTLTSEIHQVTRISKDTSEFSTTVLSVPPVAL